MATALDPLIRTVYQLMTRYGGNAELIQETGATEYDPETSTGIAVTTTTTVRALSFEYLAKKDGLGTLSNTLVEAGDKWFFIKPQPGITMPKPKKDNVIFNGVKYNVITVKDTNPSGALSILWELQLRE